jgi:hypothetical protein
VPVSSWGGKAAGGYLSKIAPEPGASDNDVTAVEATVAVTVPSRRLGAPPWCQSHIPNRGHPEMRYGDGKRGAQNNYARCAASKPSSGGAVRTLTPASTAPPACGLVGPADRPVPHPPPKGQRTAEPRRPDPRRGIFGPGPRGTFLLGPDIWQLRFGEGKMALVPTMLQRWCGDLRDIASGD